MSAWIKEKTPWPRRSVRRGVGEEKREREKTHTKQQEKVV